MWPLPMPLVRSIVIHTLSPPWAKTLVQHHEMGAERIAQMFRLAVPPILGRVKDNRFLLDLRAIFDPGDLIPNLEDRT